VTDRLLRDGVLGGLTIMIAGSAGSETAAARFAEPVARRCAALGASLTRIAVDGAAEDAVAAMVADAGAIDVLVVDGAGLFASTLAHGETARHALRDCLDGAWNATRAVANGAFLSEGRDSAAGGRIVNVAPPPDAGEHAGAARAGLENLARTLSVEWARHRIVTTTIAPGPATSGDQVAALVAFLASPAGSYYSGCRLELAG
jgi:NAD(P)-dependent dehydrogenase (short-subunit alcohol dehydrogenase family)